MGFITALLAALDRTDFFYHNRSRLQHFTSSSNMAELRAFQPTLPKASADKRRCTLSTGSLKGSGCILGITAP